MEQYFVLRHDIHSPNNNYLFDKKLNSELKLNIGDNNEGRNVK